MAAQGHHVNADAYVLWLPLANGDGLFAVLAYVGGFSAATGMAVLVALIRGIVRHTATGVGNFWVDLTRTTLYILIPLATVVALLIVSQGVVQTLSPYKTTDLLQSTINADGATVTQQVLAVGPAASQIAIKQLGTNGGGFFNVNSAHPFENPTPLSNFLQVLSILLIAAALYAATMAVLVRFVEAPLLERRFGSG